MAWDHEAGGSRPPAPTTNFSLRFRPGEKSQQSISSATRPNTASAKMMATPTAMRATLGQLTDRYSPAGTHSAGRSGGSASRRGASSSAGSSPSGRRRAAVRQSGPSGLNHARTASPMRYNAITPTGSDTTTPAITRTTSPVSSADASWPRGSRWQSRSATDPPPACGQLPLPPLLDTLRTCSREPIR